MYTDFFLQFSVSLGDEPVVTNLSQRIDRDMHVNTCKDLQNTPGPGRITSTHKTQRRHSKVIDLLKGTAMPLTK